MKGNTKLLGFGLEPRKDNPEIKDPIIMLGRWGVKTSVVLSREAIDAIRKACAEVLPIRPAVPPPSSNYRVEYDERMGHVSVKLAPLVAKQLAEMLRLGSKDVKLENAELAEGCAGALEEAYEAHVAYTSTEGEPGVDA
jgi:hypothetical protein